MITCKAILGTTVAEELTLRSHIQRTRQTRASINLWVCWVEQVIYLLCCDWTVVFWWSLHTTHKEVANFTLQFVSWVQKSFVCCLFFFFLNCLWYHSKSQSVSLKIGITILHLRWETSLCFCFCGNQNEQGWLSLSCCSHWVRGHFHIVELFLTLVSLGTFGVSIVEWAVLSCDARSHSQ